MASDSSLKELYTNINEPWYENFYTIDNKSDKNDSCSIKTLAPNHSTSTIMNQISEILFQDTDEEIISCQEEAAINATEKFFYDILEQEYSYSSQNQQNLENSSSDDKQSDNNSHNSNSTSGSICSTNCSDDGWSFTASQIQKGTEEAMKFVPNIDEILFGSEYDKSNLLKNKIKYKDGDEERASKQIAIFADEPIRNETYERILHFQGQEYIEEVISLRKLMINESKDEPKELKASKSSNTMVKKRTEKRLTSDLRPLLFLCAQAVCINDHHTANKLIKQIRQNSSPKGDWSERLAHYFVNGLEARLAGTGSEICRNYLSFQALTAVEFLTTYRAFFVFCPYVRISIFFSNQTILNVSKNASKVHIIDFCIQFGFHWLSLFECFSKQECNPPKIKITGIDNPLPGFRPAKRVEETGRRLADYAKSFNIPFEYNGIVSKLVDFNIDDLKIEENEVIVICLSPSQKLSDETTDMDTDSPRDKFLRTIRKIKPNILIHAVENSSYSTPFFNMRFKEALFHYSSLFDMLDSNMPRDNEERFLLESKWLGPIAINAIACEGSERVERPETYKHWQARNTRAGFVRLPVDQDVLKNMKKLVRRLYHKEFVLDEDNDWVVLGWKGRILFAESTWKCNDD
ncbi:hypothetical protein LUZ60_003838 [Juncus effusus]|nr:hypothetical protein LUZ60_003838 [Juncus effusus]